MFTLLKTYSDSAEGYLDQMAAMQANDYLFLISRDQTSTASFGYPLYLCLKFSLIEA